MTLMSGNPVTRSTSTDEQSRQWFDRAQKSLAGGVSSSARMMPAGRVPVYMERGHGSRIWDVDGREYVDCLLSYGSVILGHADAGLTATLTDQLESGTMFGACNRAEVELAEQICRMVPCSELVRYANSGSEAIAGAVRAARGYTGRNKILKFEGHYHGWTDVLAVSNRPAEKDAGTFDHPTSHGHSRGIPATVVDDVIICPWNEPAILKSLLDEHGGQIAAVIAEPLVANNACILPQPGYLENLRSECNRRGIVLIFDEIVTGFRIAPGGAQEAYGVIPDIAVYSKALGGGLPISAFAGKRKIMDLVAANTVKHGGTYNGNPLCSASALYTLQQVAKPGVLQHIDTIGKQIIQAIERAATDHHVDCVVQGVGSMFQVLFMDEPRLLSNYRDLFGVNLSRYDAFRTALMREGVFINSSGLACWFVSAAHQDEDVHRIAGAIDRAMAAIA